MGLAPDKATLLLGDWVRVHTFGWTEFGVDEVTGRLAVTTWGIEAYTELDLATDASEVVGREPQVVQRFTVDPLR